MPRFSLIIPTFGRAIELAELLASIVNQKRGDIEVIIVDQNEDARVAPLVEALPSDLTVLHIRLQDKNPSMARNAGLAVACGADHRFSRRRLLVPAPSTEPGGRLVPRKSRLFRAGGRGVRRRRSAER